MTTNVANNSELNNTVTNNENVTLKKKVNGL